MPSVIIIIIDIIIYLVSFFGLKASRVGTWWRDLQK